MKKIISLFISFFILLSISVLPASAEGYDLEKIYNTIDSLIEWKNGESSDSSCVIDDELIQNAGNSVYDWFAFSAARMGSEEDYSSYVLALEGYVNGGNTELLTDYQRIALTALACGGEISSNEMLNKAVFDSLSNDNLSEKTVNALLYALLILDSKRFEIPSDINLTREAIISQILSNQLESGAFALTGNTPDTDVTCIAIQALTPYYNDLKAYTYIQNGEEKTSAIRDVVDLSIEYLSSIQHDDGDMPTWGNATSESTAQTIIALCCLGIDPLTDERFIKNGNTLIDGLMKYSQSDGGFAHTLKDGEGQSNAIAGVQSFYALVAYLRFENGQNSLFDLREESSGTLSDLASTYSKLEVSSTAPQSDDNNTLSPLGTIVVIAIGAAAVAVIIFNHKKSEK